MGKINIIETNVGESQAELDEQVMPVLVLALLTIRTGNDTFAPFLIVAPLIEVYQKFAYKFDTASKGGWRYKVTQSRQIIQPLCAVPVLKEKVMFQQNPHNDKNAWYYVIAKDMYTYGN